RLNVILLVEDLQPVIDVPDRADQVVTNLAREESRKLQIGGLSALGHRKKPPAWHLCDQAGGLNDARPRREPTGPLAHALNLDTRFARPLPSKAVAVASWYCFFVTTARRSAPCLCERETRVAAIRLSCGELCRRWTSSSWPKASCPWRLPPRGCRWCTSRLALQPRPKP